MRLADAQALWDARPGWLDTAGSGLPPRPAVEALLAAIDDWRHGRPPSRPWAESVGDARGAFARLVGAAPADVAVGSSVSALVGLVAAALPDGTRVLVPDLEFTSNVFPWLAHADRGLELVTAPVARLPEAVDGRVGVVAFSLVQSATGQVAPLDEVVAAAQAHGVLTVVDASQACGWLPVSAPLVDVLVCAAYKWLMAPRGAAFLVVAPPLRDRLRPLSAGWYAGADPLQSLYGPPLRLAPDARRFDISPAWLSWIGAAPALQLLERIGVAAVHAHDVGLANRFRLARGLPPGDSPIVTLPAEAAARLGGAGIRAAVRGSRVRLSFHVYSTERDVDDAVGALAAPR